MGLKEYFLSITLKKVVTNLIIAAGSWLAGHNIGVEIVDPNLLSGAIFGGILGLKDFIKHGIGAKIKF